MAKSAIIIGGGVGGLATACLLGKAGYPVTVLEKNDRLGGRAGQLKAEGFTFDTGPSWYLMPDVFEHYFELLDERVSDYLDLVRLQPGYRVFYKNRGQSVDVTSNRQKDMITFESIEPGAGRQLERYLDLAQQLYGLSIDRFLYRQYDSIRDLLSPGLLRQARHYNMLKNMHRHVAGYFTDERLQQIMEYPLVFLGASPYQAPAIYSLLSHTDFTQGVFYPMGGMYRLIEALVTIGKRYGVKYRTGAPAERIIVKDGRAAGVRLSGQQLDADIIISNADIHHTETQLLSVPYRDHSERYWQKRTLAPSALLIYLGINKQYSSLLHHNLLFSQNWHQEFNELFGQSAELPSDSSLYVCVPSKTDHTVAPRGHENLFVLAMLPAGLACTGEQLATYVDRVLATLEKEMHLNDLRKHIVYKKYFGAQDFASTFNSFKGTGLGLSHTLLQTAVFRPGSKSKKVKNLYFVGANVHPGIGLPPALISAELLYNRLLLGE
jgi:phytoene desaturase